MPDTHELKIQSNNFEDVVKGIKTLELRKADRDFKKGDFLRLKEWSASREKYTGQEVSVVVTHIVNGGQFGLENGYVAMSIQVERSDNH